MFLKATYIRGKRNMDREHLDLSISSIEMIHSIINDIENGEDVGYNASIIPDLEYAVECIKDTILAETRIDELLKPIKSENEDFKKAFELFNEYSHLGNENKKANFITKIPAQKERVRQLVLTLITSALLNRRKESPFQECEPSAPDPKQDEPNENGGVCAEKKLEPDLEPKIKPALYLRRKKKK